VHDTRVARRYAQALFDTAVKYDVVQSVEDDLGAFHSLLERPGEFRHFFIAPYSSRTEKIEFLDRTLGDRITALTLQLLRVMLEKGRERELQSVRTEFLRLRRDKEGVTLAVVTSAVVLDANQRSSLCDKLEKSFGHRVEAEFQCDPRLLGGIKVAYGSYVLDGTVKGALSRLRDVLRHDVLKQA
jgi:F-type H+-transporting ATPase subunit delta